MNLDASIDSENRRLARDGVRPSEAKQALRALFGYSDFRAGQEAIISSVLAGGNVLAIMPTGAGKSLCYQLPAMMLPGCTLVISPLLALMKDQLDSLPEAVYERTALINSNLEPAAIRERVAELADGRFKLVYATPERLRQAPFLHALKQARVGLLVIDEAHCLSLWGHDFRPDYLFVRTALELLGEPRVLAMTATATPPMQAELRQRLGRDLKLVSTGVLRPNLYLESRTVKDNEAKLRALVQFCRDQQATQRRASGIVYVSSREKTEQIARLLRSNGVMARAYHAGLPREQRELVQNEFMIDRTPVMVATVAFGMGVDKANVRFVAHFNPPRSLEAYAQESGRAGRDGRLAHCLLLITTGDRANMRRWLGDDVIPISFLRALYAGLKRSARGPYVLVDPVRMAGALEEELADSHDESEVRVAISLLERAGLLRRHLDLPRQVALDLSGLGASGDTCLGELVTSANLGTGHSTLDSLELAAAARLRPDELEQRLLDWQEQGWLTYRPYGRQLLVELVAPPTDSARRVDALVEHWRSSQEQRLDLVLEYAALRSCRHAAIARHFGLEAPASCQACNNCAPLGSGESPEPAESPPAELDRHPRDIILECVGSLPFGLGKTGLTRVLRGSVQAAVKADRCRNFGALSSMPVSQIEREIEGLVERGFLERGGGEFRILTLTDSGRQKKPEPAPPAPTRDRRERPRRSTPVGATSEVAKSEKELVWDEQATDLFERLRNWRRIAAGRQGVPPYVVCHDSTLRELASRRPADLETLAKIKGMGQARLDNYGDELLELLSEDAVTTPSR